jgi:hypothetical protein
LFLLPVPEDGLAVSHEALEVSDQSPLEETSTYWLPASWETGFVFTDRTGVGVYADLLSPPPQETTDGSSAMSAAAAKIVFRMFPRRDILLLGLDGEDDHPGVGS